MVDVAPGEFEFLFQAAGAISIAGGLDGIAIATRHLSDSTLYYWTPADGLRELAKLDKKLIGMVMIDEILHVATSNGPGTAIFSRYDVTTGARKEDPILPDDRVSYTVTEGATAIPFNGKILFFGGCCREKSVFEYDPQLFLFRSISTLPVSGKAADAATIHVPATVVSQGLLVDVPTANGRTLYEFEPVRRTWSAIASYQNMSIPYRDGTTTYLLQGSGTGRLDATGRFDHKVGYHLAPADDGGFWDILVDNRASTMWNGDIVFPSQAGPVGRWSPPTEAEWENPQRIEYDKIKFG